MWAELEKTALVGTARESLNVRPDGAVGVLLAMNASEDATTELLRTAGALTLRHMAGYIPSTHVGD
ncbi:MAG: hypothetical protein AAF125_20065, partial [Chloroflexota bacterium]